MLTESKTQALEPLLEELWRRGGTDLLLLADAPPLMRVAGILAPLADVAPLSVRDVDAYVRGLLSEEAYHRLEREHEHDMSFSWREVARFRANVYRERGSYAIALRLIPFRIPTFTDLGLPPVVQQFVAAPQGLVLVTGPTGSGKSTTLASMIDHINQNRACHILTIEDPIEYIHRHSRSAVSQREVGEDTHSFARALRSALREDPDVLLIGEMRDLETIQTALTIAETGHLVFATLHTNDTAQALDRIVDVFPGDRQTQIRVQLANTLTAIIYQRLTPRIGGGLVAAYEVLIGTHAVRNLIREGNTRQLRNVVATGQREGMQTLEMALEYLVDSGQITLEDARARSLHPKEIKLSRAL